jgi:regulator of replication initiation timing
MTEEEKVQWKLKVFRECEKTDDIIQDALGVIDTQRENIKSIIDGNKAIQVEYKEAVERIGWKARGIDPAEAKAMMEH